MSMVRDIRTSIRVARRSPLVSLGGILCIALGIGATTALYGVLEHMVLHPLQYPRPREVVLLRASNRTKHLNELPINFAEFNSWRQLQREAAHALPFRGIAAYQMGTVALSGIDAPERLDTSRVSEGYFDLLGVTPVLGRTLGPADAAPGAAPAAMISERLWQRQFGGDAAVIGRAVRVNDRAVTIVGIVPAAFRDPYGLQGDCWMPLESLAAENPAAAAQLQRPDVRTLVAIARLGDGVTLDAARTAMNNLAQAASAAASAGGGPAAPGGDRWEINVLSLEQQAARVWKAPAIALFAAVLLVLIIACINVATLLLARASERERELAVRVSLGAGRWHIARQLTIETLVLAVPGALGGLLCAMWLQRLLIWLRPAYLGRLDDMGLDLPVLIAGIISTTLTAALCTSLPLWHALRARAGAIGVMSQSPRRDGTVRRSLAMLTIAEIALGVALLATATIVTRDLLQRLPQDQFAWRDKLTIRLSLPADRYATREQRLTFLQQAADRVRRLPGVSAVAQASIAPFDRYMLNAFVSSASSRETALASAASTTYSVVSPDYFDTLRIALTAGRAFTARDAFGTPGAFIVSESLAKRLWPGRRALGQPLAITVFNPTGSLRGDVTREGEVVGVAPDIRGPDAAEASGGQLIVYAPVAQHTIPFTRLIVSAPHAAALAQQVRVQLAKVDPAIVPDEVRTLEEMAGGQLALTRFYMALTQLFAGAGVTLAAIGVYAVTGYMVHRRRRELAVRAAVGASPWQVFGEAARGGAITIAVGLTIGSVGAFLARRVIAALIVGSGALGAGSFGLAAGGVIAAAGAAVAVGALRAVRLDPIRALREL